MPDLQAALAAQAMPAPVCMSCCMAGRQPRQDQQSTWLHYAVQELGSARLHMCQAGGGEVSVYADMLLGIQAISAGHRLM